MPKYTYIDYVITQTGKDLTSTSSFKINRYDNKVSRFVFNLDGTIPDFLRLYCAFLNPQTKKYFYTPVLEEEGTYYVIIGTKISYYVSRWEMQLVGISPEYSLDGYEDIDETLVVWVSNTFRRATVIGSFISDDAVLLSDPNIDKALDDLIVLRDTVLAYTDVTAGDVSACENLLAQCQEVLEECQEVLAECIEKRNEVLAYGSQLTQLYSTYSSSLQSRYEQYAENLRQLGGG